MKTKIIAIIGGISFATLFYDQRLGLNCLLLSIFFILILFQNVKRIQEKWSILWSGIGMLLSAAAVTLHGSNMAVAFYFFSSFLFIGCVAQSQVSSYLAFFNGVYTTVFGSFHGVFYPDEKTPQESGENRDYSQLARISLIPLGLSVIFIFVYYQINPIFSNWVDAIDLGVIDYLWFFTAILGSWITANISRTATIKEWVEKDLSTENSLKPSTSISNRLSSIKNEIQTGTVSLIALNVLLVVFLISEFVFVSNIQEYPASVLSDAVHAGVYASIASIVLAIVLILIFFRGDLNFVEKNTTLKNLSYLWIGLNVLLTLSVLFKTYIYIDQYGLSLKRIGVLMYLSLCVIGLFTTYLKISRKLNFVYLLRRNATIGFTSLLLFSFINWSSVVTKYNIENEFIDYHQFSNLLPQNAAELQQYDLLPEVNEFRRSRYISEFDLAEYQDRNWQEYNGVAASINAQNNKDDQ
ncbi:hypothetical protein BST97_15150 [Nonlabens spongiae]|uniref:Uncharacterized protein n=1 Tax=Nonlabens spongiae TaxID=331648 RepID=A0A1W6MNS4_9FLAO|nr:DUF4173 domain-containing protein [Nonlabens spongiae]ARN79212.1 hypothetical protein BST97_15150 [Nonlabens spongiae]